MQTEEAKLEASDGAANDYFGFAVSISGETAVVGAYADDDSTYNDGSAYIFVRSGSTWTQQQKLGASDGAASHYFGKAVSISGETAVVGAQSEGQVGDNIGSAYIFVRNGSTWTEQQKLEGDGTANDEFGYAVSISVADSGATDASSVQSPRLRHE